ncbi:hypothetical protein Dimus_039312 [Dionaea muscipula]
MQLFKSQGLLPSANRTRNISIVMINVLKGVQSNVIDVQIIFLALMDKEIEPSHAEFFLQIRPCSASHGQFYLAHPTRPTILRF